MIRAFALCADVKTPFSYPWFTANILTTPQTPTFFRSKLNKRTKQERETREKKKANRAMKETMQVI
jgi:hypothetical protein